MRVFVKAAVLVFVGALLVAAPGALASEETATAEGQKCVACHDKAGSKLLTDKGKYFETQRTLDGYTQLTASFGRCTQCHVRRPGSAKLTKTGKKLNEVVADMSELREWLAKGHPVLEDGVRDANGNP